MSSKSFSWVLYVIAIVVFVLGASALAEPPAPGRLSGVINDYTAATDSTGKLIGPWEVRGKWNLKVDGYTGYADFSAALSMEYSDYWLANSPSAKLGDPASRSAHTHHIIMTDATVSYDTTNCPSFKPPTTDGFVVTGTAKVTGNGGPAPFGEFSPLQICITGGSDVPYSNVTLVFGSPASLHFGSQAIHGAVSLPHDENM